MLPYHFMGIYHATSHLWRGVSNASLPEDFYEKHVSLKTLARKTVTDSTRSVVITCSSWTTILQYLTCNSY